MPTELAALVVPATRELALVTQALALAPWCASGERGG